ncbi:MAG: DUF2167 domain-containing protein, partial [Pseudomonadota bacterium]
MAAPLAAQEVAPEELPPEIAALLERLDPKTGKVSLPAANATLDLGADYIFYDADDAREILTVLWGNPPETVQNALGLVMPAGSSPLSDEWGAVVSFEETGYVSDDDAQDTDYDELLASLQKGTEQSNQARMQAGYPEINLVGWAERPVYDRSTHSVVWAQDLAFSDSDVNTLNYDVRSLGRYGVLSLNLVSGMPELPRIREAAKDFAMHASFDEGARYQDFDPSTDSTADYGIAGLIAGGAGAAALAKKTGFLAVILAFLAKFGKFIAIGALMLFGALWTPIKRYFGGAEEEEYYEEEYYEEEEAD